MISKESPVAIIAPCFNESDVVLKFLSELETVLSKTDFSFQVIIVDDYSTDDTLRLLKSYSFKSKRFHLTVLRVNYNVGHQDSIRQGLLYIQKAQISFYKIIVMDSDGEDDPNAIIEMLSNDSSKIIFVERGKRSESQLFRLGYFFYKAIFRTITNRKMNHGNFSMIDGSLINSIASQNFFHYASFLSKQKADKNTIKYDRRNRIDGKSKMNYHSLIFHGLYSLIEFAEEVLFFYFRLLLLTIFLIFGLSIYIVYSKYLARDAVLGWASSITLSLFNSCLILSGTIVLGLILLSIKKIILQKNQKNYEQ